MSNLSFSEYVSGRLPSENRTMPRRAMVMRMQPLFLLLASFIASLPINAMASDESEMCAKMLLVQQRFGFLAQLMDSAALDGTRYYPLPQWALSGETESYVARWWEKTDARYKMMEQFDPQFATRILHHGVGFHWDFLMYYGRSIQEFGRAPWATEEARFSFITPKNLDELVKGDAFRDPFAEGYLFGYVATERDFMFISRGPDGDSDILPFLHRATGAFEDLPTTSTMTVDWAILRATSSLYNGPPHRRGSSIIPPITKYYDPTNGIISDGDVVFHRWGANNSLFE